MQLLKTTVHRNWQEITRSLTLEYASLWRTIQVSTILSVLAVLVVGLAQFPRPWRDFLRLTTSYAVYCILPLWYVYRVHKRSSRLTLSVLLSFAAIAALASLARPLPVDENGAGSTSPWSIALSLIVLLASSTILVTSYRAFPSRMQWLGVTPHNSILNLIIGAMAGGTLGLHLLLSTQVISSGTYQAPRWPVVLWTFCTYAGLQALGEELLFRGLSLSVLWEGLRYPIWKAAWRVTFLNLLVCLAWVPYAQNTGIWLWIVAYRMALALVTVYIRHWQKSIIPGLVANVLFNLFAAAIIT